MKKEKFQRIVKYNIIDPQRQWIGSSIAVIVLSFVMLFKNVENVSWVIAIPIISTIGAYLGSISRKVYYEKVK